MGIDPGTAITGYGVIEVNKGGCFTVRDFGCIRTSEDQTLDTKLVKIYEELKNIMKTNRPDCVVVEQIFFNKNSRTAMAVGHARGVAILAAAHLNLPIVEYTPLQVKQALVGYGRAHKRQVQQMVKVILNLNEVPKPDDAADALGLTICHAHHKSFKDFINGSCM